MKKITAFLLILLLFTACTSQGQNPNTGNKPAITIEGKEIKPMNEQEKQELLTKLNEATHNDDANAFAETLTKVYANGWEGNEDLKKAESAFYMKWFNQVETKPEQALNIAEIVYSKVYESWRFKYLKVHALEKLGLDAFKKGDMVKAKEYAQKIMGIEYRPEGVNLMAKVNLEEANKALKENKKDEARQIVKSALEMDIRDESVKKALEELMKKISNS